MTQDTPRPAAKGAKTAGAGPSGAKPRSAASPAEVPSAGYDWQDPLALEDELTPDERSHNDEQKHHGEDDLSHHAGAQPVFAG